MVRRDIRRRIVLGGFAAMALLMAMIAITIRTWPYANPVIAQEPGGQDASFDGISQLIAEARRRGSMLHVLWTHGMCTHEMNWAADRAMRLASALGGAATQTGASEETTGLTRLLYRFDTPGGEFDATFVLWSPMTQSLKRELAFNSPGSDRARVPLRARNAERRAQDQTGQRLSVGRSGLCRAARGPHSRRDEAGGLPRAWRDTGCRSAMRSDRCRA